MERKLKNHRIVELKKQGLTGEKIRERLDVSVRTITRIWKMYLRGVREGTER